MPRKASKPIRKTTKGKGANYRPTKSGAGMTKKGVAAYRKANPGSNNPCFKICFSKALFSSLVI